jgi:hypothetical protein
MKRCTKSHHPVEYVAGLRAAHGDLGQEGRMLEEVLASVRPDRLPGIESDRGELKRAEFVVSHEGQGLALAGHPADDVDDPGILHPTLDEVAKKQRAPGCVLVAVAAAFSTWPRRTSRPSSLAACPCVSGMMSQNAVRCSMSICSSFAGRLCKAGRRLSRERFSVRSSRASFAAQSKASSTGHPTAAPPAGARRG